MSEPNFGRVSHDGEPLSELRILTKAKILGVADAVAAFETRHKGKTISRTDVLNRVLDEWASSEITKASLINNVVEKNPTVLEFSPASSKQRMPKAVNE